MKRFSVIFILLLFSILLGCENDSGVDSAAESSSLQPTGVSESNDDSAEVEIPGDFNFSIDFGVDGQNNIDSYNDTFTKDLIGTGSETIDFTIPDDKMREIYAAFIENKVPELPDDINFEVKFGSGDISMTSTPSSKYSVTYTCENETRTIVCDDGGPWNVKIGPPDTRNRLVVFVTLITDYIFSTDEYKNMSPAEGAYY